MQVEPLLDCALALTVVCGIIAFLYCYGERDWQGCKNFNGKYGDDPHTVRAAKDNGVAYFEVTAEMRHRAKQAAFAEHYGMGPSKFTETGRIQRDPPHQFIRPPWSRR